MELDPKYVDVIVRRWQSFAGKQATLDGDGRAFDEIAAERTGGRQPTAELAVVHNEKAAGSDQTRRRRGITA